MPSLLPPPQPLLEWQLESSTRSGGPKDSEGLAQKGAQGVRPPERQAGSLTWIHSSF